ncbi:MAG: hypothetical protein Q7U73_17285 [Rubrivivax sp.]|nr:hypothetical protein [Rubrivivax sp.]
MSVTRSALHTLLPAACLAASAAWAQAPATPPGFVASPDIYKVLAENDKHRVIEVIWKPGQKDQLHSHPDAAVYYLADCRLRNHPLSGPPQDGTRTAGRASVQGPIAGHSIENIGNADCKLIMFEPK